MSIQSLFNTVADVYSVSKTQDAVGGEARTWTKSQSAVPCRCRHLTFAEKSVYGRLGEELTHRFYFDASYLALIAYDYKIIVTVNDSFGTTETHYVRHVEDPHGMAHFLQVDTVLRQ